jgi:hypothetical protein
MINLPAGPAERMEGPWRDSAAFFHRHSRSRSGVWSRLIQAHLSARQATSSSRSPQPANRPTSLPRSHLVSRRAVFNFLDRQTTLFEVRGRVRGVALGVFERLGDGPEIRVSNCPYGGSAAHRPRPDESSSGTTGCVAPATSARHVLATMTAPYACDLAARFSPLRRCVHRR